MTDKHSYCPSATHFSGRRNIWTVYRGLVRTGWFGFVLTAALLLSSGRSLAGEDKKSILVDTQTQAGLAADPAKSSQTAGHKADTGMARWRVFSLKHISAQQGKQYLAQAEIGTVSKLPGANMLLVTAQPRELVKATAIMRVVDAERPFVIKTICPVSSALRLASSKNVAEQLGDILIGTFIEPPIGPTANKAIIGIHNNAVVVVAPADQFDRIASVIRTVALEPADPNRATEPNRLVVQQAHRSRPTELAGPGKITAVGEITAEADVNDRTSPGLFNDLLNTLAEAERKATEANQPPEAERPNEPVTVEAVQKATLPSETATVSQPPQLIAKQLKKTELSVVIERLNALEAAIRTGLQPEAEPEKEKAAPKIEQPNDVNEVTKPSEKTALYRPEVIANGKDVLSLDLPEQLKLEQFLSLVGKHLKLDFLYDPKVVQGMVTLRLNGELRGKIKVKQLYPLLESVLQFHGFVMTRKDNLVTIRQKKQTSGIDPPLVRDANDRIKTGDVVITRIFELDHIDTASAKNLLVKMELGITIEEVAETGTLIVTGYAYRMARIEQLLEMVDKPGEPKEFRFRELQYTRADALAPKLKTLVEQLGEISISIAQPTKKPPARTRPSRTRPPVRAKAKPPSGGAKPQPSKPTVYLDYDERTNRILMIGYQDELDTVESLIDTLDVEQKDLRTLRLYEIQNIDAEEVRNKLEALGLVGAARATSRRQVGRPRPTAKSEKSPAAGRITSSTTTEEALVEQPQVIIIESTNSLLVNATAEQHAQIAMIIGYVDSETEVTSIPYVVYPLENKDPEQLGQILNKLIQETTEKKDKEGKIQVATKQLEEDIYVIPDPSTYSLIVYASKKNQQWISTLIEQLDKYRPQVLLDVTLVQITKTDAFDMDLDLLSSIPDMSYVSGFTGVTTDIADLLLAPASDRSKFIELQQTRSIEGEYTGFKGFYGDKKINALLTAIQTRGYGRIMARPKLLVNDNEEAQISTTGTTYVSRTETQQMGTDNPVQSQRTVFDQYSAGISLAIKPHISTGDMLRLEVTLNRSGFTESLEGLTKPPNKSDADVTTVVTIPDKSTIILGGMEKVEHSKGGKKIPLLGDLPILGGFFREVKRSGTQDKLYIFVKAHILRPGGNLALADLKAVSHKNREAFEKLETEMQSYQDWPGIKPQPMDPVRILESD